MVKKREGKKENYISKTEGNMATVGIDLGTTNSLVSVWTDEGVKLIPNSFGEFLTPSIVNISNGEVTVGKIAQERLITDPENTFKEFKRHMGTKKEYWLKNRLKAYNAEDLSALVLRQLKLDAENYLGESVEEAIISVPAYFNDKQRNATRKAGRLAGFRVERLINEPSAAAMAHRLGDMSRPSTYFIFDFGGGTLDVSIVEAFENIVEIQAVAGDNMLGGKNFNEAIAMNFCKKNNLDPGYLSLESKAVILRQAELCKIELTTNNESKRIIRIEDKEYTMEMTNQELINISAQIFVRMTKPIQRAINDGEIDLSEIDEVILVGGSSKMPVVHHYINSLFESEVISDENPDEVVALGAGVVTGIKSRDLGIKDMILSDICPFTLGIKLINNKMSPIIERNSILPCSKSNIYNTVSDMQDMITVAIYQGEELKADQNLLLKTFDFPVKPKPAGESVINVKFTYDINGIFDIEVKSLTDDNQMSERIISKELKENEANIEARIKELEKLKIPLEELNENKLLIERGERLYVEASSSQKVIIVQVLDQFKAALESQKQNKIRKEYIRTASVLSKMENMLFHFSDFDADFWNQDFDNENEYEDN